MIYASLATRRAALLGLWLLGACSPLANGQASATSDEIALRIDNGSQQPLRCVAVLAHFVTRDLPTLAADSSITIHLGRDQGDGSLSYGHHGDKPLLLENLLCGLVTDWTASRQDVPLRNLRAMPAKSYSIACHSADDAPLTCEAPTAS